MNVEPTFQPTHLPDLEDVAPPRPALNPAFIVACEGSGADILAQLLAAHPDVRPVNGPEVPWSALAGDGHSDRLTGEDASRDTTAWLRSWAVEQQGSAKLLLDHDPRSALRVPFLKAVFPEASFVHLVRDGRDVARALMPRLGDDKWLVLKPRGWRELFDGSTGYLRCSLAWREVVETALGDLAELDHVLVRYEHLIERSEEAADLVLRHLGLTDDEEQREAFAPAAELARDAPNAQRYTVMRWRAVAAERPFELRAGNALIADLLERLGYDPAPPELAAEPQLPRSAVFEQRRLARMVEERDGRIEDLEVALADLRGRWEAERNAAEQTKRRLAAAERQASSDVEVLTAHRDEHKARSAELAARLEQAEGATAGLEQRSRALTQELERLERANAELAGQLDEISAVVRRTATSRSWRLGHGLARFGRILLLKRPGRDSPLDATMRRLDDDPP